jgi:hypothetical protein
MDTQIIDDMTTFTSWMMCNHKMWYIKTDMQCCKKMGWGQMKWKGVKTSQ